MNLLLLAPEEIDAHAIARIGGERARHLQHVLKLTAGATLKVGIKGGLMGRAEVLEVVSEPETQYVLRVDCTEPAPAALPIHLFLALPRPNMLGRLLRDVTSLGVKQIHLFQSAKVEKSYWQTPTLFPESVERLLTEGLTQARDTIAPAIFQWRKFSEALAAAQAIEHCELVIADPFSPQAKPTFTKPVALFIGPEGGFTDDERSQLLQAGAAPLWLGSRILRVEPAVIAAIGHISAQLPLP